MGLRARWVGAVVMMMVVGGVGGAEEAGTQGAARGPALEADEKGWVVLFRGDDAGLWNTDAGKRLDRTGYAAALDRLTGEVKYVRVKRMDTGEAVIAEITKEQLTSGGNIAHQLLFQVGKQTWQDEAGIHKMLGLAATGLIANAGEVYVWKTRQTENGYGGWGLGRVVAGGASGCWQAIPVGKLVVEVAVKGGELSALEKKDLLVEGSVVVTKATWGKEGAAVDVTEKVQSLVTPGNVTFAADEGTLGVGDGSKKGRVAKVTALVNGKEVERDIPEGRSVQIIAPPLKSGVAVGEAAMKRGVTAAAPPQVDAQGWMALFRGSDPGLWDTDVGNPDMVSGFAGAVSRAPEKVLYLRMKRMDTGDSVIVPMASKALRKTVDINRELVWQGGAETWDAGGKPVKFLGIADEGHRADNAGDLLLWHVKDKPDDGLGGWGFGKAAGDNGKMREMWAGRGYEGVVEIAVKDKALTAAERGDLLIPGKIEILQAKWGSGAKTTDVRKKVVSLIAGGYIEATVDGAGFGDPAPNEKKQLAVTYKVDDVPFTKTVKEGDKLVILAAPMKAGTAGGRGQVLTHDELIVYLDAGMYTEALAGLNRALALTGDAAAGMDRHDLLMIKGECLIATKQKQPALTTYALVEKEAGDVDRGADAIVMAYLEEHSINGIYKPAGVAAMNVLDRDQRKGLFDALWVEQKDALEKASAKAMAAGSVVEILAAGEVGRIAQAAEVVATGKANEAGDKRRALAIKAGDLMRAALEKDSKDSEAIYTHATSGWTNGSQTVLNGLSGADVGKLNGMMTEIQNCVAALLKIREVYGDVVEVKDLGTSAEKLGARVQEIKTHRYN